MLSWLRTDLFPHGKEKCWPVCSRVEVIIQFSAVVQCWFLEISWCFLSLVKYWFSFFFFNFSSSVCLLNRHLCPRLLTVSNPRFAVLFQSFSPLIPTLFRREQVEVAAGEADQTSENSQSFPKSLFSLWFPFQWLWSPLCSLHDKWDQQNLTKLGNKGGVSQGVWETTTYFIVLLLRQLG